MPMTLESKLRWVRLRCAANISLDCLAQILTAAGLVALVAILCQRLAAINLIQPWTLTTFIAACALMFIVASLLNRPTPMQASLLLDERLHLKERVSTTIALSRSDDPFAVAACQEAHRATEAIDVGRHFPVRPSREWLFTCSAWVLVLAAFFFLPTKDIFGFLQRKQEEQAKRTEVKQAETEVKQLTTPVTAAAKQLDDSKLDAALAALGNMPEGQPPEMAKQEAIRKLGDLADKLKEMQADPQKASVDLMQDMLKQLKGSPNDLARNMQLALAKGDFAKASQMLRDLQKKMEDGSLAPEQKKAAAEGLQELAKQLEQLAEKNKQMEDELEKQGLDKKLAQLSPEALQKALQQQGLDQKKVQELVQKAAACKSASSRCSGLGKAMAACAGSGGLSADDLQALAGELDKLDNFKKQAALSQAVLDQIESACNGLGQGMCKGIGRTGPWRAGSSDKTGSGTGGPGRGYGARDGDKEGDTSTSKTRIENTSKNGPVVASWYTKDEQVKGEPLRNFSEVVQAGRDSAAEAISENRIPRKYEEPIKEYFGAIEEAAPKK
jgi:hypothetical protein